MCCSVWEIVGEADGGLSVLRTFRLLRVLKLVRFLPALRRQLVVLMKTMDNVATFCMLLMLFIFIFRYILSFSKDDTVDCRLFSALFTSQRSESLLLSFFLLGYRKYYHMYHHLLHRHTYSYRQCCSMMLHSIHMT